MCDIRIYVCLRHTSLMVVSYKYISLRQSIYCNRIYAFRWVKLTTMFGAEKKELPTYDVMIDVCHRYYTILLVDNYKYITCMY